jgi:mannose/fructose/N-acetylgalactosamine-specific phosphotransferase system component IIC
MAEIPNTSLGKATIIIGGFTEVVKIATAHLNGQMSAEVAMANVLEIIRKVNP